MTRFRITPAIFLRSMAATARSMARNGVESGADDQDHRLDHLHQQLGVGKQANRGRVDHHPVEHRRGLVDDRPHPLGREAAHRIRIRPPGGQDRQVCRHFVNGQLLGTVGGQRIAQPGDVGRPEGVVNRRPAQIGVNQQHPPLERLAERQRQIRRRDRLAFAGQRAGDHHDLGAAIELQLVQRRRRLAILLRDGLRHVGIENQPLAARARQRRDLAHLIGAHVRPRRGCFHRRLLNRRSAHRTSGPCRRRPPRHRWRPAQRAARRRAPPAPRRRQVRVRGAGTSGSGLAMTSVATSLTRYGRAVTTAAGTGSATSTGSISPVSARRARRRASSMRLMA